MNENWFAQFSATWDLFVSVKLPAPLRGRRRDDEEELSDGLPEMARPMLPLVGALLGLCAFIPAWALLRLPGNPAAALVCGIALPAMLEYMTRGRALAAFASFMEGKWHGMTVGQAASRAPDSGFDEAKSPSGMILILSVYAFKAACVGALVFSSHPSWFIVAFAGAATVQAHLAGLPAPSGGVPFMETPDRAWNRHWHFAALAMLLGGIAELPAAIAALALAWGLSKFFERLWLSQLGCVNAKALLIAGFASELALLLLGVLLLA